MKKHCTVCKRLRKRYAFELCGERIETTTCRECNRNQCKTVRQAQPKRKK